MKTINESNLTKFYTELDKSYSLLLPSRNKESEKVDFNYWNTDLKVALDQQNTATSPREYLLPKNETYLKFQQDNNTVNFKRTESDDLPQILFGIRPCDMTAINRLDQVFLSSPVDELYERRRNNTITIVSICLTEDETCFCRMFGLDPLSPPPGTDIVYYKKGDNLYFKAVSSKGEKLLKENDQLFTADNEDIANKKLSEFLKEDSDQIDREQSNEQSLQDIDPELLYKNQEQLFSSSVWQKLARRCLECGICTYLCPTCHCFDIQDFAAGKTGERYRCWDSCLFSSFTQMAQGENPRETTEARLKQRFYHKLAYYPDEHEGKLACVGCGRCIRQCPVNIDIVEVLRDLGGELNV